MDRLWLFKESQFYNLSLCGASPMVSSFGCMSNTGGVLTQKFWGLSEWVGGWVGHQFTRNLKPGLSQIAHLTDPSLICFRIVWTGIPRCSHLSFGRVSCQSHLLTICNIIHASNPPLEAHWRKKYKKMLQKEYFLFLKKILNIIQRFFCKLMMYVLLSYVGKVLCREKGFL